MAILALAALIVTPAPSLAAEGYDITEPLATIKNPNAPGEFPIRRGYYDAETDRGFGFDKAYHKHGLTSLEAIKKVSVSPQSEWQGDTLVAKAYVGKYTCNVLTCNLEEQREVKAIFTTATRHHDLELDSQLGMITIYCENPDKAPRCPEWVQDSILRPGTPLARGVQGQGVSAGESYIEEITVFSYELPHESISR
ncbi:hypothetical protein E4U03_03215 [Rothia nasimurium]|uniref:Uncharacterized protein n=1 Tax=Rothia nasimurium TaxID=85336 RepID=A0A4Y9F549_9MICC|nr:hypothetical protein [Rothia nasimurium]MBF0807627.1 hypothetical protein [Rothia nasimurium]TFU23363.1 hypothetical protein E4U03_03215 [Rothia nasimurium]